MLLNLSPEKLILYLTKSQTGKEETMNNVTEKSQMKIPRY